MAGTSQCTGVRHFIVFSTLHKQSEGMHVLGIPPIPLALSGYVLVWLFRKIWLVRILQPHDLNYHDIFLFITFKIQNPAQHVDLQQWT